MENVLNLVKQYKGVVITLGVIVAIVVLFFVSATTPVGTMLLLPFYLVSLFMLISGAASFWQYWKNRKNQDEEEGEYTYE